jgi:endonuclease YncB( thermonuclease family)
MRIAAVIIIVAMVLNSSFLICCNAFSGEVEAIAVAVEVHDGDTFRLNKFINGSITVRLADIDAPELGQPLSSEATEFLKGLVLAKTVYLDIDDVYMYDYSGTGDRLVCVVYVGYNSTHYENVNKALWVAGLAEKKEYDNEFNADTWTLYVPKTDLIPEFPSFLILPLSIFTTLLAVIVCKKKRGDFAGDSGDIATGNRFKSYRQRHTELTRIWTVHVS